MMLRCAPVSTAIGTCEPHIRMVIIGMNEDSHLPTTLIVARHGG